MMRHLLSIASFVVFVSLAAPRYAAEPEFAACVVTESRTYERDEVITVSPSVLPPTVSRVAISRVTVALESERLTGEWRLGTNRFIARSDDFPVGTNVQAATRGNQLLLKHPDGRVVRARIVDRVKPGEDEDERH